MQTLSKVLKIIDKISIVSGKIVSVLAVIIMLLQVYEVVTRYGFNRTTIWIWELCVYMYGVIAIVGGAWVMQEDKHVRTDVIVQSLPKRVRAIFESILLPLLAILFLVCLSFGMTKSAINSWAVNETSFNMWEPPLYHFKFALAYGFIILLLQATASWIRNLVYAIKEVEI